MEGSMCHNGAKIMEKRSFKGLERAPHPADWPDISLCDFWTEQLKEW
jgi:hypothetical protein